MHVITCNTFREDDDFASYEENEGVKEYYFGLSYRENQIDGWIRLKSDRFISERNNVPKITINFHVRRNRIYIDTEELAMRGVYLTQSAIQHINDNYNYVRDVVNPFGDNFIPDLYEEFQRQGGFEYCEFA